MNPDGTWAYHRLSGPNWKIAKGPSRRQFIQNAYRVLLTRAREGMVIWVPKGDASDKTQDPEPLNLTAKFLAECGARPY
jgi:hypothetical protein